ncbi:RDD family protein [Acidovorax sacchari]|uniref:RDD family protein n=1 Tax=Acidovorax sacchari TaxID=3230736 RepID=UPI0039E3528F
MTLPANAPPDDRVDASDLEYVGFWARLGATLLDTVLLLVVTVPLLAAVYGWDYFKQTERLVAGPADFLISWVLPAVVVLLFWFWRQATPGKMNIGARVVDAETGRPMTPGQAVGRYLAYFVSAIPLCLGFVWVAFDRRKQGWHDKLAGTVVVRPKQRKSEAVLFVKGRY